MFRVATILDYITRYSLSSITITNYIIFINSVIIFFITTTPIFHLLFVAQHEWSNRHCIIISAPEGPCRRHTWNMLWASKKKQNNAD